MTEIERPGEKTCQNQGEYLDQIIWPSVRTRKTLEAVAKVDRSDFAPDGDKDLSYSDYVIPLGDGSSLSQPSLVAEMIDHLDLNGRQRVLEIGTGSGYNAAILSHLAASVDTIEYDQTLAQNARERLQKLGYTNVRIHTGDGAQGLPNYPPYDAIIITAGVKAIPYQLEKQLAEGGRIIGPVGENPNDFQLTVGFKRDGKLVTKQVHSVNFHPLISKFHGGWDSYDEYEEAGGRPKTSIQISMLAVLEVMAQELKTDKETVFEAFDNATNFQLLKREEQLAEAFEKFQLPFKNIDEEWAKLEESQEPTPEESGETETAAQVVEVV